MSWSVVSKAAGRSRDKDPKYTSFSQCRQSRNRATAIGRIHKQGNGAFVGSDRGTPCKMDSSSLDARNDATLLILRGISGAKACARRRNDVTYCENISTCLKHGSLPVCVALGPINLWVVKINQLRLRQLRRKLGVCSK